MRVCVVVACSRLANARARRRTRRAKLRGRKVRFFILLISKCGCWWRQFQSKNAQNEPRDPNLFFQRAKSSWKHTILSFFSDIVTFATHFGSKLCEVHVSLALFSRKGVRMSTEPSFSQHFPPNNRNLPKFPTTCCGGHKSPETSRLVGSQPVRDPFATRSRPVRDPFATRSRPVRDPFATWSGHVF